MSDEKTGVFCIQDRSRNSVFASEAEIEFVTGYKRSGDQLKYLCETLRVPARLNGKGKIVVHFEAIETALGKPSLNNDKEKASIKPRLNLEEIN